YNQAPEVTFQSLTPIEPEGGAAKEEEGKGSLLDQLRQMEDRAGKPPALPPGVTLPALPGQPQPAAPAAPQGLNLPPVNQPATPLVPLAPVQTLPAAPPPASIMVQPAPPQAAPGPAKTPPPPSAPPWSK
ncbi:MAG: hypothetical protein ACREDU_06210, partial [Methylocella sp.]